MKVVGIDPSLTCTGVASNTGWCDTVGRDGITALPLPERITAVDRLLLQVLELAGAADLYVIESPSLRSKGGGAVERHGLYWLMVRTLLAADRAVAVVAPTQRALYATGKGNASKSAVIDAVARRLPQFETGGDDNACDAVALMAMGADYLGQPLCAMPATHRKALVKVAWPESLTSQLGERDTT